MSRETLLWIFAVVAILSTSCNQLNEEALKEQSPTTDAESVSEASLQAPAIPLATAVERVSNWRALKKDQSWWSDNALIAFRIPTTDYKRIKAKGAMGMRAYMGLSKEGQPQFLLVGVDGSGVDMTNQAEGQFVYNFSQPCPMTCPEISPLYTGIAPSNAAKVEAPAVGLQEAVAMTKRWRQTPKDLEWSDDHNFQAFLLPIEDFIEIAEQGAAAFRLYLAIDEQGYVTTLLNGVDSEDQDMLDASKGQFIYAAAAACPAVCDKESPLFATSTH